MIFIITGVSGVGKSTLVNMLFTHLDFKKLLARIVTYTDRSKRKHEQDAIDYHFISTQEFIQKIKDNFFIEYQQGSHYYGTSYSSVADERLHYIIVVDPVGAQSLKNLFSQSYIIYIKAHEHAESALSIIERRLIDRASETTHTLSTRLKQAQDHLREIPSPIYDYTLVNNELEQSFEELSNIISKLINKQ